MLHQCVVVIQCNVCLISADVNLLQPHVPHILSYIERIANDEDHTDSVIAATCGLLGYVFLWLLTLEFRREHSFVAGHSSVISIGFVPV